MRKFRFFLLLLLFNTFLYAQYLVSGKELFEKAKELDNKKISIIGECIGDMLFSENAIWINLRTNDGYFIGVVIDEEMAKKIKYLGRYRVKGDTIKITGIFHAICPVHYGDPDIHAENLEVLETGEVFQEEIDKKKIFLSILLSFATLFFVIYFHKLHQKDNVEKQQ